MHLGPIGGVHLGPIGGVCAFRSYWGGGGGTVGAFRPHWGGGVYLGPIGGGGWYSRCI